MRFFFLSPTGHGNAYLPVFLIDKIGIRWYIVLGDVYLVTDVQGVN